MALSTAITPEGPTTYERAAKIGTTIAQRILNDYLVSLDAGFGLRTALNDEILGWLSETVDREVNIYWGGQSFASSRPELVDSGLLPGRLPGEVYAGLALRGEEIAERRNRIGDVEYLELYAPLDLGLDAEPTFFVSTPLLAQERAVSEELALLVEESERQQEVTETEREILINALELNDVSVKDVMTPRSEVVFLDLDKGFPENLELAIESTHTRFPLVRGHLDQTEGLIHIKDVPRLMHEHDQDLMHICRPLNVVPISQSPVATMPR